MHLEPKSRRTFLKQLTGLLAAGNVNSLSSRTIAKAEDGNLSGSLTKDLSKNGQPVTQYTIAPWTGDDFRIGHRFRDREFPKFPLASERKVDFVIVGGGMSGLAAAYYLRDHNVLLLEQYDQLGGQSRGDVYHGIGYSYGSAYISNITELIGKLLDDLKLRPIQLGPDDNSWYWNQEWVRGISNDKSHSLHGDFKRLMLDFRSPWNMLGEQHSLIPLSNLELSKLDKLPFSSLVSAYGAEFLAMLDNYLKSYACVGMNGLSALAGVSILRNLISPCYVLLGGNPTLAGAMAKGISNSSNERCQTSAFVWSVELKDNGASVVYSLKDGTVHKVECRHVIMAVPPLVAARLLNNASTRVKVDLLRFRYGSYLVANILLRKKIFHGSYSNWFPEPLKFSNLIIAEAPYQVTGAYRPEMGSVLTVYRPYAPASEGRTVLLKGNRTELASTMVNQLGHIIDALDSEIDYIVLSRWGHAIAVANPGYFTNITNLNNTKSGVYSLAHSSMQGLASVESAVSAARLAVDRALGARHSQGKKMFAP